MLYPVIECINDALARIRYYFYRSTRSGKGVNNIHRVIRGVVIDRDQLPLIKRLCDDRI